ncbi:integrase arm-type DNA-binding domain-containing protein [Mangrovicoccus sp. HB182678]|uniref:Integrase arm-type DNA-binding domain-containing protein n=2 Tax=Mangrovicoccus algicola TaxID=2771008 RepID=A0A8J6YTH5_9RHOB|nr:integrase arm-type DNA-binding domain-containing protein [Mangrovicoccus algicola]
MPKVAKEMSALAVKRAAHPGGTPRHVTFAAGGVPGLLLQITATGAKSWLLKTVIGGTRRNIGLGPYPAVSLADARDRARETRDKIRNGIDPIEERKAVKAALSTAQRRGLTFADAMDKCLAAKLEQFKNPKHRQQWRNTLTTYALPHLGPILVQDIAVQDVLRVLEPIWYDKTETASRLRGRIETVLSWATVAGHRTGDNPARWAGNLKELLPAATRVKKKDNQPAVQLKDNQPAVQLDDARRWFAALRRRDGMGSRALEFATLCASRSQEVNGARWDEIDMEKGLWIIPAERMKREREHRVPMPPQALNLLKTLPRFLNNPLVFPAPAGEEMSDSTMRAAMKRLHEADVTAGRSGFVDRVSKRPAVPHGLRSTFRDWVAERTNYPSEMAEVALAHKISSSVEAAYRRGDMVEKRRRMMADWSDFLRGRGNDV